ncbi:hypothetical protein IAT38_007161 [Cryptococcus sp. DSM 104549]
MLPTRKQPPRDHYAHLPSSLAPSSQASDPYRLLPEASRGPSPAPSYHDQRYSNAGDPYADARAILEHTNREQGAVDHNSMSAPSYHPPYSSAGPNLLPPPASRLPFFEAALARSRGEAVFNPGFTPSPAFYAQPLPSYLPPPDPNHPDLSVGLTQSSTIRLNVGGVGARADREASRSPSPDMDDSFVQGALSYAAGARGDLEKGLLAEETGYHRGIDQSLWGSSLDKVGEKGVEGDISLLTYDEVNRPYPERQGAKLQPGHSDINVESTQHYGPAPTGRVGRRTHNAAGHRRIKQSATLDENGFFVVDMPIPTRLSQFLPVKGVEEQKSTRYTAVTTDPDDFPTSGLRLRQNMFDPPRQTELFIVITMYNEDAELFCRTLYGVMKNIAHLCGRKNSRVWGKDGWQKASIISIDVVVCIVADGRKAVNPRVLDCLAALGVFQEGAMTNSVNGRPVTAHVFEYTTSFALDADLNFKYPDKGIVPCQIIFCLKEKNAKKINSHRWFFNGFAPLLSPNICVLLDVGTRPALKSIYHLWKAFDLNSNVGGACGEIATFKGKTWRGLLNPLVAAQCFEYKMSNILDKPLESLFGYCTVLPGAFSAYRWIALQNNADGTGPLSSYVKGEQLNTGKADTFTGNIAKTKANWVLKFVKAAVGETDCPDTIPEFISQRRRWLNGSFFAAVYALIHVAQIWRSDHSLLRKMGLMLESLYNGLSLVFAWFSLANFFIFFVILTSALEGDSFNIPHINILNYIAQYGYLGALVSCFIFGMGNRPQGAPWKYKTTIYIFAVLTLYMMVAAVLCTVQAIKNFDSAIFSRMVVSLASTYGVFVVSSFLALDPWHLFTCFLQYILFSPTYVNVLNAYAYSNLHDLSWGTKGSDAAQESDLGAVHGVGKHVEVELVSAQQDIDIAYQDALDNIRLKRTQVDPPKPGPNKEVSEQAQKDVYANFRTNVR